MTRIRRAGFVFLSWRGDHAPRHVHVFRNGRLVAKWDLDGARLMEGTVSARLVRLIRKLQQEGRL
jgi:hypothetical protein